MVFPIAAGGQLDTGSYQIDNSLLFNDGDSPYLSRSFTSVTNTKKFTASFWFKPSQIPQSNYSGFLDVGGDNAFALVSDNTLYFFEGGGSQFYWRPKRLFRDCSAWYHIVLACDSTLATQTDRVKIYVNGVRETDFYNNSGPSQNYDFAINTTGNTRYIGTKLTTSSYYDGYLAEFYQIDGQQLAASDFGEFDDSGIWKPIAYTGTFGNAGYYLDFENSGSLGADQSGNGNNFTPVNLASVDQFADTPTNNFCTLLNRGDNATVGNDLIQGNLAFSGTTLNAALQGTHGFSSGKWYWEVENAATSGATASPGIMSERHSGYFGTDNYTWSCFLFSGDLYYGPGQVGSLGGFANGDILNIAVDMDNKKAWFGKNGSYFNSGNPATGTNPTFTGSQGLPSDQIVYPASQEYNSASFNFGCPPPTFAIASGNSDANGYGNFEYSVPSGFYALCTKNMADQIPTAIDKSTDYFETTLHTGNNGSGRTFTGLDFQPDLIWGKVRNSSNYTPFSVDSSRGGDKFVTISSNASEDPGSHGKISSFNSDGTTWIDGTNGTYPRLYYNDGPGSSLGGSTYVFWQWHMNGGSTSTNTNGTVATTVQANQTAGQSIVTFTMNGSSPFTWGHGLSQAPQLMIIKNRSNTNNWDVYHYHANYPTAANGRLQLNSTGSYNTTSGVFNNTHPTSTVATLNASWFTGGNDSLVAYCFHSVPGYSNIGIWNGNGNNDGQFVYTGFKPKFLLLKQWNDNRNWIWYDSKRDTYNQMGKILFPNSASAEDPSGAVDFYSNGFKWRNTNNTWNASGYPYVYYAIAENPFVTSTGVPVTAR